MAHHPKVGSCPETVAHLLSQMWLDSVHAAQSLQCGLSTRVPAIIYPGGRDLCSWSFCPPVMEGCPLRCRSTATARDVIVDAAIGQIRLQLPR